jgi:chromosome segregation ATPase
MADDLQVLINVKSNADEATRGLDKLGSSVAKNLKVVERLQKQYKVLADGFNKGKITAQVYAAEVTKVENAINRLNASNNAATKSTKKMAEAQMAATKASNRMGVVTQQAGYQVSDFIVQVQSGTNVFVAFGQQASQLVGVLPLVADKIGMTARAAIALSASLGIIIPLVTLFGASWLRSREAAEDAGDKLRTTEDILKDLKSSISDADKELRLLHSTFTDIAQLEVVDQIEKLEQQIQFIKNEGADAVREYVKALGGSEAMLQNAEASVAALAAGKQEQIDTLQANLDTLIAKQQLLEIEESYAELLGEINDIEEDTASKNLEILTSLRERQALAEAYLAGGDEAVKKEERLREVMALVTELQSDQYDFTEAQIQAILRQVKAAQDLEDSVEDAKEETKALEEAAKDAAAAFEKMSSFSEGLDEKIAVVTAELEALGSGGSTSIAKTITQLNYQADALYESKKATGELTQADKDLYTETKAQIAAYNAALILIEDKEAALKAEEKATREAAKAYKKQLQEAEKLRKELEGPMVRAIGTVSDAFGDFIARGLTDFKGFVKQILGSFQNMVAQMIATAARNKIMLSLGLGGSTLAGQAAAGQLAGVGGASAAGPIGSFIGSFAGGGAAGTGLLGGLGTGISAFSGGVGAGFGASFSSLGTILSGGSTVAAGGAGFAATLGAAIPAIAAIAVVIGLFTKKTKLLDSGLRTTVEGFDVAIETFKKTQSSRLFGLLKGRKITSYEAADAELADPLIEAIGDMQQSIVDAAGTLGIGAAAFDNFSYQFKVSLKGLTEEEQLQKINEEITKMGDSFASLSGHFETMNELLAAATQRYDLETRVLQLLGNETELLIRQRERERAATHELNRGMLDQVYALEDAYSAVNSAFATVQRSIEARKAAITSSFNDIMDAIQGRLAAAQSAVGVSGGILSSLEGASGTSGMTRGAGLAYLRSLRGASRISDQKKLDDALQAIAEPSEGLYTNFVDYQRDFADQRNLIRELEEKAGHQLSTDEQTLLEIQNEADAAQARYDGQIDKLDEQLAQAQEQLNALYGINTSVKDVSAAIADLSAAVQAALSAQAAAKAALAGAGTRGGAGAGVQEANAAGQQILNKLGQSGLAERKSDGAMFQKVNIRGSAQLLQVASDLGVKTSGKTGAQIQQAISNAGNLGVNMDNKTRALQFAMGGMFGGGLRMVGERGPELEATGPSRIFSTKQTAELFRNPELVAEVKNLREEVAGLRSEQRQLQASNSKYVKRNYDINRKWDTEGLPATRT